MIEVRCFRTPWENRAVAVQTAVANLRHLGGIRNEIAWDVVLTLGSPNVGVTRREDTLSRRERECSLRRALAILARSKGSVGPTLQVKHKRIRWLDNTGRTGNDSSKPEVGTMRPAISSCPVRRRLVLKII